MKKVVFSDEQVISATGISQADLRRLITWNAVRPTQGGRGRGRVRGWGQRQLRWVAMVGALNTAGLSLRLSHTLVYEFARILQFSALRDDDVSKAPWLKKEHSKIIHDPAYDSMVMIVNNKFVFLSDYCLDYAIDWKKGENGEIIKTPIYLGPKIVGVLSNDATLLCTGHDIVELMRDEKMFAADMAPDPQSLSWIKSDDFLLRQRDAPLSPPISHGLDKYMAHREKYQTALSANAYDALERPKLLTLVNLGMCVRIAMRKALGLPVDYPGSEA